MSKFWRYCSLARDEVATERYVPRNENGKEKRGRRPITIEEALLGVSMTGCCDHPLLNAHRLSAVKETELVTWFRELKQEAIKTNEHTAKQLGINSAAAVTCVKPSGTVSQPCNTASGLHPRFAPYYIGRVRNDIKDPLCQFMIDQGIPHEVDKINPAVMVFSFPMAAPKRNSINGLSCSAAAITYLV
jgi:ribonucleoside-triphosphate reductase (thioredoxin)